MLTCLVRQFSRNLKISSTTKQLFKVSSQPVRNLIVTNIKQNDGAPKITAPTTLRQILDVDDYLVPYSHEHEKIQVTREIISEQLQTKMRFTDEELKRLFSGLVNMKRIKLFDFNKSIDIVLKNVIKKKIVIENPWLLFNRAKLLENKLSMLQEIQPKDINDFIPFLKLSLPRLNKLVLHLKSELGFIPNGNRIYYISEKLHIEPKIVSNYLSKRLFMLEMPFEMLSDNLDNMVDYGVEPLSILRDLWAFRYTPKSVRARLERAKIAKKDKIMPWMVRCPETILERSFKLTLEEKELLGDQNSVVDYVSERLGFDTEMTRSIMEKHPAVFKVRVTKIKTILDYLLNEAGFSRYDIAQVPRILCHSLDTTRRRIEELKSLGCVPSTLVIVCRSRREYQKFITNWMHMKNQLKNRNN